MNPPTFPISPRQFITETQKETERNCEKKREKCEKVSENQSKSDMGSSAAGEDFSVVVLVSDLGIDARLFLNHQDREIEEQENWYNCPQNLISDEDFSDLELLQFFRVQGHDKLGNRIFRIDGTEWDEAFRSTFGAPKTGGTRFSTGQIFGEFPFRHTLWNDSFHICGTQNYNLSVSFFFLLVSIRGHLCSLSVLSHYLCAAPVVSADRLKRCIFHNLRSELPEGPYSIVYMHSTVQKEDNSPGITILRWLYEYLPSYLKDMLQVVYFVHPGLQSRLVFATLGRFFLTGGLYWKIKYESRLQYLWDDVKKGEVKIPKFVKNHDDVLEHRPLTDYGIEPNPLPMLEVPSTAYSFGRYEERWTSREYVS
ncbi:hypothetical protein DVH24_019692 [Malus domestica]|uniref:CRAL-TRIO domain-containing protein n=1 Tax=Malus domestica TaxID=3750 RepID=A0A498I3P9_MALDO|nr:hypothetical protein DVH24_019692 [Malus domestica]